MIRLNERIYVRIYSGGKPRLVDVNHLQPSEIHIADIAHALSLQCRYGGHLKEHYSVAQHCVLVSQIVERIDPTAARWGHMHDAAETYLVDVLHPIKRHLGQYRQLEERVLKRLAVHFGLPWPIPSIVEQIDHELAVIEQIQLQNAVFPTLPDLPGLKTIEPWSAIVAEMAFLERFLELEVS